MSIRVVIYPTKGAVSDPAGKSVKVITPIFTTQAEQTSFYQTILNFFNL